MYSVLYAISLVPGYFLNKKTLICWRKCLGVGLFEGDTFGVRAPCLLLFLCAIFWILIYLHNTLTLCFFLYHNWLCVYFYSWINIFHFHCCFFGILRLCCCCSLCGFSVTFVSLLLMLGVYLHECLRLLWFLSIFLAFSDEIMLIFVIVVFAIVLHCLLLLSFVSLVGYYCFAFSFF